MCFPLTCVSCRNFSLPKQVLVRPPNVQNQQPFYSDVILKEVLSSPLKKKKKSLFLAVLGLHCCLDFLQLQRSGTTLQLWGLGPSLQQPLLQQSMGSWAGGLEQVQHAGSAVSAPGL